MNGGKHVDSRSISYLSRYDSALPWNWAWGHDTDSQHEVTGIPDMDKFLYKRVVSGTHWNVPGKLDRSKCSYLLFQTDGDGMYEMSFRVLEHFHKASLNVNRTYSILLNDVYIVNEYQVEQLRKSPEGVELVVNFRVYQKAQMFELHGHPGKTIEPRDKNMKLEVCYSNCSTKIVDPNWSLAALSIVKFAA